MIVSESCNVLGNVSENAKVFEMTK